VNSVPLVQDEEKETSLFDFCSFLRYVTSDCTVYLLNTICTDLNASIFRTREIRVLCFVLLPSFHCTVFFSLHVLSLLYEIPTDLRANLSSGRDKVENPDAELETPTWIRPTSHGAARNRGNDSVYLNDKSLYLLSFNLIRIDSNNMRKDLTRLTIFCDVFSPTLETEQRYDVNVAEAKHLEVLMNKLNVVGDVELEWIPVRKTSWYVFN